jgi:hypothetical protein
MQWIADMYRYRLRDPEAELVLFVAAPVFSDKALELVGNSPGLDIRIVSADQSIATTRED